MKKDVRLRVVNLIKKLNYSQIQLRRLDIDKVRDWCLTNLPKTTEKFRSAGFDLNEATTWEEICAYNTILNFYGNKVAIYFTFSWLDYQSVKNLIESKKGAKFRDHFGIDCHSAILLSPEIFFKPESFDEFRLAMNFERGYNFLDYSYFNDDENVESDLEEFQWMNEAAEEEPEPEPEPKTTKKRTKKNVTT